MENAHRFATLLLALLLLALGTILFETRSDVRHNGSLFLNIAADQTGLYSDLSQRLRHQETDRAEQVQQLQAEINELQNRVGKLENADVGYKPLTPMTEQQYRAWRARWEECNTFHPRKLNAGGTCE